MRYTYGLSNNHMSSDQRVDQDEDHETSMPSMLLSLPNEASFLPESRDREIFVQCNESLW